MSHKGHTLLPIVAVHFPKCRPKTYIFLCKVLAPASILFPSTDRIQALSVAQLSPQCCCQHCLFSGHTECLALPGKSPQPVSKGKIPWLLHLFICQPKASLTTPTGLTVWRIRQQCLDGQGMRERLKLASQVCKQSLNLFRGLNRQFQPCMLPR